MSQTIYSSTGPPVAAYLNPLGMLRHLRSCREMIWQFARRDIVGRYRAARLGLLWAILTPLILLVIYTFVFTVIFQGRWGENPNETRAEYALALFCGMITFNLFAEVVSRAPVMVVSNPNYVKKVVFPLEILPVSSLLSAGFNMLIGFAVWIVGWLAIQQTLLHGTIILLPVVLLPVALISLAAGWFLASLGVFIRDMHHAVMLIVQMLFFLTPIFYRVDFVPQPYRKLLYLNPLTHAVENVRAVMMWGHWPNWSSWAIMMAISSAAALIGYAFFMKSKRAFADVI